ncbi:MAG: class I adenylate-forming enzyme family protein, partial [Halobacteria archaeon]|nr:class I adenylate-forming enzyme family protein [Halobacteria archaeon]
MNVYEYFRENFKRAPESEALVGDSRFTYAELDERAGEIAGWVDSNTSDGGRVAVLMHDCPEYVAVVLGIWRAGRVACPVNTMLSPDETEYVIRNSDAGTVVHSDVLGTTAEEMADRVGASAVGVGELDASPVEVATSSDDDTAMVMHTSGTTGRPKGVVHTHRNITAQVECGVSFARLGRDDTVAVPVPLFHVGGFHVGVLMSLFSGGTVAVQEWWNAEDWARIVEETGATVTGMVPTMMVDVIETEAVQEYDVSSLRLCLYGGSSASASV